MFKRKNPEQTEQAGGGEPGIKKSKKKIILMIVPLLAAGAGAFFFLGGSAEATGPTTTVPPIEGEVIEIDTLTVNLIGEEGRYARIGFAVVLDSTADSGEIGMRVPLIQDAALGVMTHYDAKMLQSPEGQDQLRDELSRATVALFPNGEVMRVVLTELIVQ